MNTTTIDTVPIHTVEMTHDVASRQAALSWIKRRNATLLRAFIVCIAVTPLVCLGIVLWRSKANLSIADILQLTGMWTLVIVAVFALVGLLIGIKYIKFTRRVRPIVERGAERIGSVTAVDESHRRGGGVNHYKVAVTVLLGDGQQVSAFIEEAEGGNLPRVKPGASALAWTHDGKSVVATSGALFGQA